jgi:hypothetical protein
MKSQKDISKGEFQHRMFKLVILIIVFVFCALIVGFIYITVTSKTRGDLKIIEPNYTTGKSILKSNEKYQTKISQMDLFNFNKFFNKYNDTKDYYKCEATNFYKKNIYHHYPCIFNSTNKEEIKVLNNIKNKKDVSYLEAKDIGVIDFIDKYLKLLTIDVYNKNNNNENYFKTPKLDNVGRVIINNSIKKVHIYLSPISQINKFNSYQNRDSSDIMYIYLKNNIDDILMDKSGAKKVIYYEFTLNEGDFIYAPSYYFIQIKEPVENLIVYEYQDISPLNDMIFKILYNEI